MGVTYKFTSIDKHSKYYAATFCKLCEKIHLVKQPCWSHVIKTYCLLP